MYSFQIFLETLLQSISAFLPLGGDTHFRFILECLHWPIPQLDFFTAAHLGSLSAILLYFRHDFASMTSSVLQLIIFRKRPMTLDERLPIFLFISWMPLITLTTYFPHLSWAHTESSLKTIGIFLSVGLFLVMADRFGKHTKNMCDWHWKDAIRMGLTQLGSLFPGWDFFSGTLLSALFLNYSRETAAKFAYFLFVPILFTQTLQELHSFHYIPFQLPVPQGFTLSWISWTLIVVTSCVITLVIINSFMNSLIKRALTKELGWYYLTYRCLIVISHWVITLLHATQSMT